jgi:hypothetical protein
LINKKITDVFRFARIYEKIKSAINRYDPWVMFTTQALECIQRDLTAFISKEFGQIKFDVSNCHEGPSMSIATRVAVTASRNRVSVAPNYTICLGRKRGGFERIL